MSKDIRKATWLELFFDLVFVVAIAKAVHTLGHVHDGHLSAETYLKYVLIMVPVWWAWTGHTLLSNRFDCDTTVQRLMTLAQMACAASMAVFISDDFDPNYRGFLLSYGASRAVLILMYWRAASTVSGDRRAVARFLGNGFTIGLGISLASLMFDGVWRYAVLYLGIAVDIAFPIVSRRRLASAPVNEHHLPERFGLLTIILLGESVASLVATVTGLGLTTATAVAAFAGFSLTAAIWWTYYENLERRIYGRDLGTGQMVIYLHLLIYLGLGGLANTIRFAIEPVLAPGDYKLLAGVSTTVFIVATQLLYLYYHPRVERGPLWVEAAVFFGLLTAVLMYAPSPLVLLCLLAGLFCAYAIGDALRRRAGPGEAAPS